MEKHLKFLPGEQSKFLQFVSSSSEFSTEKLARIVNISSRSYRDWLREKFSISLFAAKTLSLKFNISFPEDEIVLINRWSNHKKEVNKNGGRATFEKYGSPGTTEGRKKGGIEGIKTLREKGIIPQPTVFKRPDFSKELTEFVGIILGDGGITRYQCSITLNGEADSGYIKYVLQHSEKLFGVKPKIYKDKNSKAIRIYYSGVELINYLSTIGLKAVNKVKTQVDVPEWIKKDYEYKISCLRGLIDTDGCTFNHMYQINRRQYSYIKIGFANESIPLLNFHPKITAYIGKHTVWLYREKEVLRYLTLVGTHNKRLLKYSRKLFSNEEINWYNSEN